MRWTKQSDWHWQREDDKYTVSRALHFRDETDTQGSWLYDAWRKGAAKQMPERIGEKPFGSLSEAIAACAADFKHGQNSRSSHERRS